MMKIWKRRVGILGWALVVGIMSTAGALADAVDDYISAQMAKHRLPGLSLAVVRDGVVVKSAGYGLANLELGVPATPDTIYQWGSVTKMFTAAAVLILAEDGRLTLDDRLGKHLTNLPPAWERLTLRHLLQHTSGLKNYTSVPEFGREPWRPYTPEALLDFVRNEPLEFEPGSKWAYSNTGYFLLGLVVERVSGRDWGRFVEERIFAPAGMGTARKNERSLVVTNRASGYDLRPGGFVNAPSAHPSQPGAAGALLGSVLDLAKWDVALNSDRVLSSASRRLMWTPTKLSDGSEKSYGLGWQLGLVRGHRHIGHGGAIPGFMSSFFRLPDQRLTVIVLVNGGFDPTGLAQAVADHYVPGLLLRSVKPEPDPDPAVTARLKQVLLDLAADRATDQVTDGFRESFRKEDGRRESLGRRLESMTAFTYVTSEPVETATVRHGARVARRVHVRVEAAKGIRFYSFELAADGRVAAYQSSEP